MSEYNVWLPIVRDEKIKMLNRENYKHLIDPDNPIPQAYRNKGVGFNPVDATVYYKLVAVYHLSPEENKGKHVIFIDILDENNEWIQDRSNLSIDWGWFGQNESENAPNRPFEKRPPEFGAQVDLSKGAVTWVRVDDVTGIPSESVYGLHSDFENRPQWNTWGHNSFIVLFKLVKQSVDPVDPDEPIDIHTLIDQLNSILNDIAIIEEKIKRIVDSLNPS